MEERGDTDRKGLELANIIRTILQIHFRKATS